MKIIDKSQLLKPKEMDALKEYAKKSFQLRKYTSLEDILTSLNVDVIIDPSTPTRHIPKELNSTTLDDEVTWQHIEENLEDISNDKTNCINSNNKTNYINVPLRGLYDHVNRVIKLFPNEMRKEYGGKRMVELLVSTLAHEIMHAYFDRPNHSSFPYVIFVEEPLAEFGMLLYLYESFSPFYDWAYQDVCSKLTCYRYGARLMDQHLSDPPLSTERWYLEKYKIELVKSAMPITHHGAIIMPGTDIETSLKLFRKKANLLGFATPFINNYRTSVHKIDQIGESIGEDVPTFFSKVLNSNSMKTAAGIIGEIDRYFARLMNLTNHVTNYWPAFESFAKFIFGYYNGTVWMRILDQVKFSGTGQLLFCQLIAASCLIVSKEVYDDVCNGTLGSKENLKNKGNAYGSWFGGQFIRDKSKSWGKVIPKGAVLSNGYKIPFDVRVDKNNMASEAIKRAMIETFKRKGIPVAGKGSFSDYTACHVWDATYHPWYHTSVDNLVLVPNMIYGLTDHCPKVQEMLRYEMYKRFGRMGVSNPSLPTWLTPKKPSFYNNIIWRCEA